MNPPRIFLHIGAMKTGTTYLQSLMIANQEQLADAGYLFPGETWWRQVRAVQEAVGDTRGDAKIEAEAAGAWGEIAAEMLGYDGTAAVLSVEFLSFASPRDVERVMSSLAGAEVHVVLTVRDAARTIPALWQTQVHNGATVDWSRFMAGARRTRWLPAKLGPLVPSRSSRFFSKSQDVARILDAWSRHVPPQRMHVVTVPQPSADRGLLWERFAGVLGLDPTVASEPPRQANESLGYASTELLRRVNAELGPVPPSEYDPTIKHRLALTALAGRRDVEGRARLDRATAEFALAWNARARRAIQRRGVLVVGDLDDLPVTASPELERQVDEAQSGPTDEELLAAAADAVDMLQTMLGRRSARLEREGKPIPEETVTVDAVDPDVWPKTDDPVGTAVADVAALARTVIELSRIADE